MTLNPFKNRSPSLAGPALDIVPVVPSDSASLTSVAVSLYVKGGGQIVVTTVLGNVRTIPVTDNYILPVGVTRVHATGTTATNIFALTVA